MAELHFVGKILGLTTHSIEIDDVLVELQKTIAQDTTQNFNPHCADALEFNYSNIQLTNPIFLLGFTSNGWRYFSDKDY